MRRIIWTALILAVPRAALACPVCFGQNDSPMAHAANTSILVMLVITGAVLAGFGTFFVNLVRRANAAAAAAAPEGGRPLASEGTAQC
ncbi:MAG: hypothetical protein ACM3SQ_11750 [Betaproteobacteria bacterium]